MAVVVINAAVGFYQEYRAERSLAALKDMLPVRTQVRREGEKHEIAAEELVPGDVVLLEAGDRVPADGRLFLAAVIDDIKEAATMVLVDDNFATIVSAVCAVPVF